MAVEHEDRTALSVIIPALNERDKIARDVRAASVFLASRNLPGEIIVVDDGSRDGTPDAARIPVPPAVRLEILSYRPNRGKGYAVRRGVAASRGRIVLFADSGNCIPYSDIAEGIGLIREGRCDIAHGSRFLPESVILRKQRPLRRLSSRLFRIVIHRWVRIPQTLTDTQCGLKIYDGDTARALFARCETRGFMFDIEVILHAIRRGLRIREFPVRWTSDPDSRLSPLAACFTVIPELIRIRKTLHA
ncbi:MAG TPA: glycosyltransferase [bacterium]|nr:glycosyltransferase [bacterium]